MKYLRHKAFFIRRITTLSRSHRALGQPDIMYVQGIRMMANRLDCVRLAPHGKGEMMTETNRQLQESVVPAAKPGIVVEALGDETLLYSAEGKAIHVLNPTANLIWTLCDGSHTISDMEKAVRANFAVPEAHDLIKDVQQTLDTFRGKGLLQS